MIRHPSPAVIARNLRQLADRLDDEGNKAIQRAAILAARGWPQSTNGDGIHTSDPTSSTERAVLHPGPFDDVDNRLARQLRLAWYLPNQIHDTLDLVAIHNCHDPDCLVCADTVPAGTGRCAVDGCDHICNPHKNQNDRLRAGYCPRHYKRWVRMGRPERGWYERFTETEDVA